MSQDPPPDDEGTAVGARGDLDQALESYNYPATTQELAEAYEEREVQARGETKTIGELLGPVDNEVYDSPQEARSHILSLLREE